MELRAWLVRLRETLSPISVAGYVRGPAFTNWCAAEQVAYAGALRALVKASGNTDVRFFLSENEWRKAHENPAQFEIHFWGGVDLGTQPAEEFRRLRDGGFPLVFVDLPSLLSNGELEATPAKWRVSRPEKSA